jgi:hypothetical protein
MFGAMVLNLFIIEAFFSIFKKKKQD